MLSSINVMIRKPAGDEYATLGLRAAWAMHSGGGYEVRLIFAQDGVYNLLGMPVYQRELLQRFMENEGEVRVLDQSLTQRGIDPAKMPAGVELIGAGEMAEFAQESDATLCF